ncbi:hypothetical protein [Devosia sp.]
MRQRSQGFGPWPPPNNGPENRNWVIEKLIMNPGTLGWWSSTKPDTLCGW